MLDMVVATAVSSHRVRDRVKLGVRRGETARGTVGKGGIKSEEKRGDELSMVELRRGEAKKTFDLEKEAVVGIEEGVKEGGWEEIEVGQVRLPFPNILKTNNAVTKKEKIKENPKRKNPKGPKDPKDYTKKKVENAIKVAVEEQEESERNGLKANLVLPLRRFRPLHRKLLGPGRLAGKVVRVGSGGGRGRVGSGGGRGEESRGGPTVVLPPRGRRKTANYR